MARSLSKVCFFGLGMMGRPMAALVAQAGYPLVVSDTDQKLLKEVCQQTGAQSLDASRHLADVDVVITMLPNAQAVSNTLVGTYGLAKLLKPGACVIDMSASEPSKSQALSRDLAKGGVDWLDAPVFGDVQEALAGTLTILVGGRFETLQRHAQLLSVLGAVTHVGPDGAGHAVKVLNSYVSAAGVLATIEALQVVEKFGVGRETMTRVLNSKSGANVITANRIHQFMISGTSSSELALQPMIQDLKTAMTIAEQVRGPMNLGHECLACWQRAAEQQPL
ncbi:NAD(P)-dependent oxidoreductase [Pseudomonas taiwanensis]|uniref:NAD(P)-dependent oxidoreductase n=1 Tax=Pseudomonas taiwanensis TaxID=470150 RepID=UPI001EE1DA1A|nr:NAD(P)-dependent oxidoreductase [Pseudomonas taiwanensis]